MASRLDRLFVLLDSGSSSSTRKAAAQQIGQVQKVHPHELPTLLKSVHVYLRSSSWETRIAAGQAVEAIAENVPTWQPVATQGSVTHAQSTEPPEVERDEEASQLGRLAFSQFKVERLLKHGQPLLAAARSSTEYDAPSIANDPSFSGLDRKQQAARLRQQVMKKLGMDGLPGGVGNSRELFDDEDLLSQASLPPSPGRSALCQDVCQAVAGELADTQSNLSQREKHRAKRKAKLQARQSTDASAAAASNSANGVSSEGPSAKRVRKPGAGDSVDAEDKQQPMDTDAPEPLAPQESTEWPFESLCDELCQDLFHPSWTIRHGAATGLREIIKIHGSTAGLRVDIPTDKWPVTNLAWLEDMALRLISVLVLDRFGDYVSDEVVAPVRETSAQTLGVVLRLLDTHGVQEVLKVLLQLLHQDAWQVRHGGLLGIKYMMVVRQEVVHDVLCTAWPGLLSGLGDMSEDVRAVAAAALLPSVNQLSQTLPQYVGPLLEVLWSALLELDDLTTSTHNVMLLLSGLVEASSCGKQSPVSDCKPVTGADVVSTTAGAAGFDLSSLSTPMPELVMRCFTFFRHPSKAVRHSTLRTIQTLISTMSGRALAAATTGGAVKLEQDTSGSMECWLGEQTLPPLMCHLFQTMLLDGEVHIHNEVEKTWRMAISRAPTALLSHIVLEQLPNWICLWLASTSVPLDTSLLLLSSQSAGSSSDAGGSRQPCSMFIGGLLGTESLAEQDQQATVVRLRIAKLFAILACSLQERAAEASGDVSTAPVFAALQNLLQTLLNSTSAVSRWAAAYMIASWATLRKPCLDMQLQTDLLRLANTGSMPLYDEATSTFNTMQSECKRLVSTLQGFNVPLPEQPSAYIADSSAQLASTALSVYSTQLPAASAQTVQRQAQSILAVTGRFQEFSQATHARVQLCVACSLVQLGVLPDKLNPVIRPTMETIKQEPDPLFKGIAMETLYGLLRHCAGRTPCPNAKILRNLITMATRDQLHTPSVKLPFNAYVTLVMRHSAGNSSGFITPSTPLTPSSSASSVTAAPAAASAAVSTSAGLAGDKSAGIFPTVDVSCDQHDGVLTLSVQQLVSSAVPGRRARTLSSPVHSITMATTAMSSSVSVEALQLSSLVTSSDPADKTVLQRDGAQQALQHLSSEFGAQLLHSLPAYWDSITTTLLAMTSPISQDTPVSDDVMNQLMTSLQLCEICIPCVHADLVVKFECMLEQIFNCLLSSYTSVRHMASRVLAALAHRSLAPVMQALMDRLSMLSNDHVPCYRCGIIEAILHIVDAVRLAIVPYVVLLIVPVLSRMSDQHSAVRLSASQCFATLIRLMPLESGVPDPEGMSADLIARRAEERHFLEQLLDGSRVDDFELPCAVNAELRKYQQDGVNWLAFLSKYNLHGILCDDMGLGKTLQTICIVVSDHYMQQQQQQQQQTENVPTESINSSGNAALSPDGPSATAMDTEHEATTASAETDTVQETTCAVSVTAGCDNDTDRTTNADSAGEALVARCNEAPSLVICPPTLTGHWCAEVEKFCGRDGVLRVLHYMGDVRERVRIRSSLAECNLVVSSYDIVRNDLDFFKSVKWNYCVLDEGHVIKSNKTKITKAVKSLQASHRLILSGTPIQNNVLELWSLFDFLMPGFLGSERQFLLRYGRPIINSRDAKASSKEQEAGVLAMESLHRQVLPFILRRMKEDVLHDLPPKIIQDYCCQLSPLQVRLYEEFCTSRAKGVVNQLLNEKKEGSGGGSSDAGDAGKSSSGKAAPKGTVYAFQSLQYLQKVCNHPALVLTNKHPAYPEITAELAESKSGLHDIQHSCKLVALKQLLFDLGLGGSSSAHMESTGGGGGANTSLCSSAADILDGNVVSAHRVLLFCQAKSVLDIVESDLLKSHFPCISYLRLDGSTPAMERHGLVTRFNNDASIDMLLLTTHVGGLGLNLTGADTVIFMEHDWNPMKDLQAMDRAHRIGQKKVVNVYRLVTRGTMEERIMSLQRFKLGIANSVVTAENSSLSSMDTHQLLDLFQGEEKSSVTRKGKAAGGLQQAASSSATAAGGGGSMKAALEDLEELWDSKQYEEEYSLDGYLQSLSDKT
ncbi:TATA-binding protein-associated factor 172-like [Sycon ciliatum]|uniref:TATA-binding protein-associated factor 172-like n=1 Tax=Sycon ciliatum TaxID=27933 RepID=UPI0031F667F8